MIARSSKLNRGQHRAGALRQTCAKAHEHWRTRSKSGDDADEVIDRSLKLAFTQNVKAFASFDSEFLVALRSCRQEPYHCGLVAPDAWSTRT